MAVRWASGLELLGRGELDGAYRELAAGAELGDPRARVWAGVVARRLGRAAEADELILGGVAALERITGSRARAALRPAQWDTVRAWSRDLRWIAVSNFEEIVVVDRMTSSPHVALPGIVAALSPNGGRLVTQTSDYDIHLWDLQRGVALGRHAGRPLRSSPALGHPSTEEWGLNLVWSDDGAFIGALAGAQVSIVDVRTGTRRELVGGGQGLAFNRSGSCVSSGRRGWSTVDFSVIWGDDSDEGDLLDGSWSRGLALSDDCKLVARWGRIDGHRVEVGEPTSIDGDQSFGGTEPATGVSFDAGATRLAIAAGGVLSWDLKRDTGEVVASNAASGKSVQFAPDGGLWFMDAFGAVSKVGDTERRPPLPASVSAVALAAHASVLFGTTRGDLVEWQPQQGRVRRLASLGSQVLALAVHGDRWVAGLVDGSLRVGSRSGAVAARQLARHGTPVHFVAFGAGGTQVISQAEFSHSEGAAEAEVIRARNATTGAAVRSWSARLSVPATAVSSDGTRLAYAPAGDGSFRVEVVDLASGRSERTMRLDGSFSGRTSLGPTGSVGVLHLGGLGALSRWSAETAGGERHVPAPLEANAHALSRDARWFALAERQVVTLWDVRGMAPRGMLDGQPREAHQLAFSEDGSLIVAVAQGRVWAWRTTDHQLLAELSVTESGDALCAVSPRGAVRIIGDGNPACAVCRVGPFLLPPEACSKRFDPTLLGEFVATRRAR